MTLALLRLVGDATGYMIPCKEHISRCLLTHNISLSTWFMFKKESFQGLHQVESLDTGARHAQDTMKHGRALKEQNLGEPAEFLAIGEA